MSEIQSNQTPDAATGINPLIARFSEKYGIEPNKVVPLLNLTAFKMRSGNQIKNAEMLVLLSVAEQYGLNPFAREIYAGEDASSRVFPVVGVDGWSRIVNNHPQFDGVKFVGSSMPVTKPGACECDSSITCLIYRKDRANPIEVTEYLEENYRDTPYWRERTRRQLRHKAFIQCARIAFGFVGIFDLDEVESAPVITEKGVAASVRAVSQIGGGLAAAKLNGVLSGVAAPIAKSSPASEPVVAVEPQKPAPVIESSATDIIDFISGAAKAPVADEGVLPGVTADAGVSLFPA